MYAITFDFDTALLQQNYQTATGSSSYQNAYSLIGTFLQNHGFTWTQGSVYFGNPNYVDAVKCVLAVQKLSNTYAWFKPSVRDIRMLRVEDNNDLMPAL